MTVEELIEQARTLPPDAIVMHKVGDEWERLDATKLAALELPWTNVWMSA